MKPRSVPALCKTRKRKSTSSYREASAFTLIEMLVVMAIIALLLTLALPRYFHSVDRTKETVLKQDLAQMRDAIDKYYGDRGRYPDWLDSRHQIPTEAYSAAQIAALIALIGHLQSRLSGLRYIAGHQDLDCGEESASDDTSRTVRRKIDPGPLFPWDRVLAAITLQRM